MATNEGWPEAFGFSVLGNAPVVISAVEEGGSAQGAGLQTGDVIVELDGENVQQWSREEVRGKGSSPEKYGRYPETLLPTPPGPSACQESSQGATESGRHLTSEEI